MTRTVWQCMAVLGFVGALTVCGWAADPAVTVEPKAKQVLDRFAAFCQSVQRFRVESHFQMEREEAGHKEKTEIKLNWLAERPNKLSVLSDDGSIGTVGCDGRELMILYKGAYAVEPAPATWAALADNPTFKKAVELGNATGVIVLLSGKEFGESFKDLNPDLKDMKVSYTGRVQLAGHDCHLLRFANGPFAIQVWFDAGDQPLLRQVAPDLSPEIQAELNRQRKKEIKAQILAQLKQELGDALTRLIDFALPEIPGIPDIKITSSTKFENWEIDPKFPADAFAIHVPEGIVRVESIDALTKKREPSQLIGKPAPKIELDLAAGGRFNLAEFKDKNIVILDFWATWCGPCVLAMPVIDDVAKKYHNRGVRLYAVNRQESAEDVRAFLEQKKLDLAVPLDMHGAMAAAFGVEGIPQTVIIGRDGTVQAVHVGFSSTLGEELTQEINALIAGKNLAAETLAKTKGEAEVSK